LNNILSFYSHFDKVSITGRSQAVEILLRCKNSYFLKKYFLIKIHIKIVTASEMSEAQRRIHIGLSTDDRRFHLNIIKMLSCLLAEYIIRFDNDQTNKSSDFDMPAPKVLFQKNSIFSKEFYFIYNRKEKKLKKLKLVENLI